MKSDDKEMTSVTNVPDVSNAKKKNCCKSCSDSIIGAFEGCFSRLGYFVATHTVIVIVVSIVICGLFLIGLMEIYNENRPEKLWVASSSKSLEHRDWFSANYPPEVRICSVILERDNVLTSSGLATVCDIDEEIRGIQVNTSDAPDVYWNSICFSPARNGICSPLNVLQLWQNNCTLIRSLTDGQIIAHVNNFLKMGATKSIPLILGGITPPGNAATILGAKATKMTYFLKNQEQYDKSKGRRVDLKGTAWEEEFESLMKNRSASDPKLFHYSLTGQREDSSSSISGDLVLLGIGYALIIFYLATMLGSFSRLDHKVWLAICGVACIGLSIGVAYGLSSAFQLFVSPVHNILPFLLLGIGVDDLFVIIQNWNNYGGATNIDSSTAENIAITMKHAGVSILVTSFTDICAFLIGATTVLPALRSFCIFAGIGIIAVFLLTCTFFVAWLALDNKRQRSFRDACCCCCIKVSSEWTPMECSKKSYLQLFMKKVYSQGLLSIPGKIIAILIFLGLLAGGAYGLSQLRQDFDPDWFLPPDSLTIRYGKADDKYFPDGVKAAVFVGKIDYFAEQDKFPTLHGQILTNKYTVSDSVVSWYDRYISWLNNTKSISKPRNETEFYEYLEMFLVSMEGSRFRSDIKIDSASKKIKASRITYSHIKLDGARQEVSAMDSIQEIAKSMNFNGFEAFGYTRFYIQWETNKVISTELIRNLVLAGVVVLVITLFLIADVLVSILVLTCVGFTLVDIAGFMHFWGLTVDTVTTIQLILAIGLSVDYSAHIGHAFMVSQKGNRNDRAKNALAEIGPAVFHGGFSTFLAFVCLAGSKSYVFSTFFKVFFLVVVFGLFHGLVYLPVLLSLIGPGPYTTDEPVKNTEMREVGQTNGQASAIGDKHDEMVDNNNPNKTAAADNSVYMGE